MPTSYTVKQGDYLASIARRFNIPDWRRIYQHADNEAFRKKRPNPSQIMPGDVLVIPDPDDKRVACATAKIHTFQVRTPEPPELRVVLRMRDGTAITDEPYTLSVGRHVVTGTTSGEGLVEVPITVDTRRAVLTLDRMPWMVWNLDVGHLDPIKDPEEDAAIPTGVQARLNNIGFFCGAVDGDVGEMTRAALREFQILVMGRDPEAATGELDGETRDVLEREHGC